MVCNNPIVDDSTHPFLEGINYHPIVDDSSHLFLDGVNYHPLFEPLFYTK